MSAIRSFERQCSSGCKASGAPQRVARVHAFQPCRPSGVASMHVVVPHRAQGLSSRRTQQRRLVCGAGDPMGSLKETAALDELIDGLLTAKSQQQMAQLVAENILAVDTKFWMRLATRNDTATSQEDKDRLQGVASAVMVIVDTVRRRTEQQLEDSGKVLQDILVAAADEKGEWYLPLTEEQVQKVRDALDRHANRLDEALLSNAFAWIKKSSEDSFDGMVQLLQMVLQLYAGRVLRTPETEGVEGALNKVLYAEEKHWGTLIRNMATDGTISEAAFTEALQRRMESVVLGLQSGSYAQRVQAEYLKEVESRAKSVFKDLAAAGGQQ